MKVQHLDPEKFVRAYNVDLQLLYPWEGVVEPPFGAAWAILEPGESTKLHRHQEGETFFIVRGTGKVEIAGDNSPVEPGSVVFQRPFAQHVLTNTSEHSDLMFLTVWWEDRSLWPRTADEGTGHGNTSADGESTPRRRVMVTAAPPTPNGDLHLGHLSGPYLAADIYTRYLRLRDIDGYYACGSDDHCMYVERMGEQIGMTGQQAADHFVGAITETLDMAAIDMDLFMRPGTSKRFEPLVLELFERLRAQGQIIERETPSPYCDSCRRYLFEADISGLCPHCGDGVTGNTCETCGLVNDCLDIVDGCCTSCGKAPATRTFKRLFFPLGQHAERLSEYLRGTTMSARLRAFCEKSIADGLPDIAISHISRWGISVPLADPGLGGQTLYVWFEMAARYLAYAEHLGEVAGTEADYRRFWSSPDAEIVQFFGYDNSFYYALLLPAIHLAFDPELNPPSAFVVNEFYRLDGEKFSTSRGHSIPGRVLLSAAPRDMVRFYLAYSGPEREASNFTVSEFEETVERELVQGFAPWLRHLSAKIATECDGTVPATGDWTPEHLHFFRRLEELTAEAGEACEPETFSPQRLSRVLIELVRTARLFGATEEHWRDVPDRSQERRTGLALEIVAAKVLAVLAAPLMPDFAARLWRALGFAGPLGPGCWELSPSWVPTGQRIRDLGTLEFPTVRNCLEHEAIAV